MSLRLFAVPPYSALVGRRDAAASDPTQAQAAAAHEGDLGGDTVSFTMDVYTEVAEELADTVASAIAAYLPRKNKAIPGH